MKNKLTFNRRSMLKSVGLLHLLPPSYLISAFNQSALAQTAVDKKYLITVRCSFGLREASKTNFNEDLAPINEFSEKIRVATDLAVEYEGKGGEYHGRKQVRFGTSCTPSDYVNLGGGAFDGQSFDIATGNHLKNIHKSKEGCLIIGAYPYQDARLLSTFGSFSFYDKNQAVTPQYDLDVVMAEIKKNVAACEGEQVQVDVRQLKSNNLLIESVMREYSILSQKSNQEVKEKLLAIEQRFAELKSENEAIINSDGKVQGNCFEFPSGPIAHQYVNGGQFQNVPQVFDQRVRQMNHTAAVALASNYTRSVSINYGFSGHYQSSVPNYHGYTHSSDKNAKPALDEISNFQINMLAHLYNELKNLGILSETLVVFTVHERPTHNHKDSPIIVYGANTPGTQSYGRSLNVDDVGADILKIFGVDGANNFGGETSKGGIII